MFCTQQLESCSLKEKHLSELALSFIHEMCAFTCCYAFPHSPYDSIDSLLSESSAPHCV